MKNFTNATGKMYFENKIVKIPRVFQTRKVRSLMQQGTAT